MTEEQIQFIALMNSYNVILNGVNPNDILNYGIPLFMHDIYEEVSEYDLLLLIAGFELYESYELCAKVKAYNDNRKKPVRRQRVNVQTSKNT